MALLSRGPQAFLPQLACRFTEPLSHPPPCECLLAKLLSPGRQAAFVGFEDLSSSAETAFQSQGAWGPLCKPSCAESSDKLRLLFCFVFLPSRGNQMQRPLCAWQGQQSQEVQVTSVSSWWLQTKVLPPLGETEATKLQQKCMHAHKHTFTHTARTCAHTQTHMHTCMHACTCTHACTKQQ